MRLGIDLGATAIKSGLVDETFWVHGQRTDPTPGAEGSEAVVAALAEVCRAHLKEAEVTSVGIGLPGRINSRAGVVESVTNLPLRDVPLADRLREELGIPVAIANDANCALFGELTAGEGKGCRDLIVVTVGTGIGGAILLNGKVYRGQRGDAAEFGHTTIRFDGRRCRCGRTGCWERYASVTALIEQTREAAQAHPDSLLARRVVEGRNRVDGRTPFLAVRDGCPIAEGVLEYYAACLAAGLNNLTAIFRPERIVLTGAIWNEGEPLLRRVQKNAIDPELLHISRLHGTAGLVGASALPDILEKAGDAL